MSTLNPPRLAHWLLERLASGPKRESMIGDVMEQFQHRGSAAWYWRQTLTVIAFGAAADIRSNKLLTVRALGVGWVTLWLFSQYVGNHFVRLDEWLFETGLVSRFIAFNPSGQWLVRVVGGACCGWVVGRLHRDHQASMVFAFFMSVVLFATAEFGFVLMHPPFLLHWSYFLVASLLTPTSVLLCGLWGAGEVQSNRLLNK